MKLSVIIPVFNELATVKQLLERVVQTPLSGYEKEIIVVDDCSTDGTKKILTDLRASMGFTLVEHAVNQGKGTAIRSGLPFATGEYVIVQDADLEYDPKDYGLLLDKAQTTGSPVVFGSRRLNKSNTQYAGLSYFIGGLFVTWVANILYQQKLTDEPTCYKLFRTDFLRSLPLRCTRFEFCPEVTALTAKKGVKIPEVPISYHPRTHTAGKKIRWRDGWQAITTLLFYRFNDVSMQIRSWCKGPEARWVWWLLGLSTLILVIFAVLFGFHPNNDTDSFVWTIERFRGLDSPFHPNRYLNSFYPIIGASIFRWLSPAASIILTNILFFYGLMLSLYGLFRRVWKSQFIGLWSALIIGSAYPMIRYGLTQVQDLGGWFWCVLTLYLAWRWREERKETYLWFIGVAVGLGMLTKESGAMGALFAGLIFLTAPIPWKVRILSAVKAGIIPFAVLLANQWYGTNVVGYSSREWFLYNWHTFYETNYTFLRWAGVNATAFNILWPLTLIGLYFLWRERHTLSTDIKQYLLFVLPVSFSYFGWPLFIGRTVFMSAWFLVPIAMFGIKKIYDWRPWAGGILVALCIVVPSVLQYTIQYAPLFFILDQCQNNIGCAWNFFWENQDKFTRTGIGRTHILW